MEHILVRADQLSKIQAVPLHLFAANAFIISQDAVLDAHVIEEAVNLLDVGQGVRASTAMAPKLIRCSISLRILARTVSTRDFPFVSTL